jgi:hypothetical protein
MSAFRNQMERQGNALLSCFSTTPVNPLPFHLRPTADPLVNAWKDFIGTEHNNISVRADLTFKRSSKMFLPSVGRTSPYTQISKITEGDAVANITRFYDRLNYACYKHAYKRYGKKLDFISCVEGGRKQLRDTTPDKDTLKEIHAHLLLERPDHISFDDFKMLIRKVWRDTPWGNTQDYIQPVRNLYAATKYNVKSSLDSLDLTNTYLNTKM